MRGSTYVLSHIHSPVSFIINDLESTAKNVWIRIMKQHNDVCKCEAASSLTLVAIGAMAACNAPPNPTLPNVWISGRDQYSIMHFKAVERGRGSWGGSGLSVGITGQRQIFQFAPRRTGTSVPRIWLRKGGNAPLSVSTRGLISVWSAFSTAFFIRSLFPSGPTRKATAP